MSHLDIDALQNKMNGLACIYGNKHLQVIRKRGIISYGFNPVLSKVRFSDL